MVEEANKDIAVVQGKCMQIEDKRNKGKETSEGEWKEIEYAIDSMKSFNEYLYFLLAKYLYMIER